MAFVTKTVAEDVLESERADQFRRIIERVINRQLNDSDIDGIVSQIPKSDRKGVTRGQIEQIAEADNSVPQPEPTKEEYAALLALLIWSAGQGRNEEIDGATEEERAEAVGRTAENIEQRLNVILYGEEADTDAPPSPHIGNPNLPNGGGINSAFWIATYLHMAIQQLESEDKELTDENIIAEYESVRRSEGKSGLTRNEERADLISWEMARASAVGLYLLSLVRGALTKTWLETQSKSPRQIHLDQVGVEVPFDEYFPDGSFWSNELIECKCGVRVGYS